MINIEYRTISLNLASFLVAEGCDIQKLDTNNGTQYVFCFINTPKLKKLAEDFYALKALTQPQRFIDARRNLKFLIEEAKEGRKNGS